MDEYELEEIKREIVESRSLSIKTNNLVNALASDVKSIAKRHQTQERRLFVNTAAAYAVTIAVILGILWLLGMVSSYTFGGFLHLLLVLAIVVVLINVIQGRRPI